MKVEEWSTYFILLIRNMGFMGNLLKLILCCSIIYISCDVTMVKASSFCDKAHSLSLLQLYIIAKI